jgi:alpha-1,3-glucosyltransferase
MNNNKHDTVNTVVVGAVNTCTKSKPTLPNANNNANSNANSNANKKAHCKTDTTTTTTNNNNNNITITLQILTIVLLITTIIKILLIPSYKSTDFDVHRNWLSITCHLPLKEWYFGWSGDSNSTVDGNGATGTTVHTLDYPPSFAFFEYILSHNPITNYLQKGTVRGTTTITGTGTQGGGILNENCFALLSDEENNQIGYDCIIFQRCTVILFDIVFFIGSYLICQSFVFVHGSSSSSESGSNGSGSLSCIDTDHNVRKSQLQSKNDQKSKIAFLLLVTNSGLLILDHVHFQYNGMLLGILLSSIAMLLQSIKVEECEYQHQYQYQHEHQHRHEHQLNVTASTKPNTSTNTSTNNNIHMNNIIMKKFDLLGAILFALLLTFKHMYLTLAPLYFFYLLRRFCYVRTMTSMSSSTSMRPCSVLEEKSRHDQAQNQHQVQQVHFSLPSLLTLGIIVLITLIGPFVPFLQYGIKDQLSQIIKQLFPWQRGLCHDYWAGNIWALYLGLEKMMKCILWIVKFMERNISSSGCKSILTLIEYYILPTPPFPTISPFMTAICLLVGLIPSMYCSWKIGSSTYIKKSNSKSIKGISIHKIQPNLRQEGLLHCFIFSAMSSFMLAYHVHEKAIMTAIIPLSILSVTTKENARLFIRLSTLGHFGLLPLLYQPTELIMKVCLNASFFVLSLYLLESIHDDDSDIFGDNDDDNNSGNGRDTQRHPNTTIKTDDSNSLLTKWDKIGLCIMVLILLFVEFVHPLVFKPLDMLEFLPLMMISIWCATVFLICWIHCGMIMFRLSSICLS